MISEKKLRFVGSSGSSNTARRGGRRERSAGVTRGERGSRTLRGPGRDYTSTITITAPDELSTTITKLLEKAINRDAGRFFFFR